MAEIFSNASVTILLRERVSPDAQTIVSDLESFKMNKNSAKSVFRYAIKDVLHKTKSATDRDEMRDITFTLRGVSDQRRHQTSGATRMRRCGIAFGAIAGNNCWCMSFRENRVELSRIETATRKLCADHPLSIT
jgi:hypothetical protein